MVESWNEKWPKKWRTSSFFLSSSTWNLTKKFEPFDQAVGSFEGTPPPLSPSLILLSFTLSFTFPCNFTSPDPCHNAPLPLPPSLSLLSKSPLSLYLSLSLCGRVAVEVEIVWKAKEAFSSLVMIAPQSNKRTLKKETKLNISSDFSLSLFSFFLSSILSFSLSLSVIISL